MDCRSFEKNLIDFQQGNLSPRACSDAERHLEKCKSCRILADVTSGKMNLIPPPAQATLTTQILEKTSGPACGRVHELLCDFVDDALKGLDYDLVRHHLEYCADCHALASSALICQGLLPRLAGIEPDADLVGEVIHATIGTNRFAPSLRTRFLEWWNRLVRRPRFSFEAAYLGTVVLVLIMGNPFPAMRAISVRTVESISRIAPTDSQGHEAATLRELRSFAVGLSDREQALHSSLEQLRQKGEAAVFLSIQYESRMMKSYWGKTVATTREIYRKFWPGNANLQKQNRGA
jgi:hypothetical protein